MSIDEQKQKLENMRQLRNKLLTLSANDGVVSRNASRTGSRANSRSPREAADYFSDKNAAVITEIEDPSRFENRGHHWYQKELLRTEKRLLQEQETNARLQMQLDEPANVQYTHNVKPSVELQNGNKENEYKIELAETKRKLTAATEEITELLAECQALTAENQKLQSEQDVKTLEYQTTVVENDTNYGKLSQQKAFVDAENEALRNQIADMTNQIQLLGIENNRLSVELRETVLNVANVEVPDEDWKHKYTDLLVQQDLSEKRIAELEQTINEKNITIKDQENIIEENSVKYFADIAKLEEELTAKINQQRTEIEQLESELHTTKSQVDALQVQVNTLQASHQQKAGDIELLEGEKVIAERTTEALRENVETLQGYLAQQTGMNEQKAAANDVLLKEKVDRMHESKDLWAKIDQLQDQIAPLKAEIRTQEQTVVQQKAEIDALEMEVNKLRRDLARINALLKHCREEVEEQVKSIEDVHAVREGLSQSVGTTQRALDDARLRLEACEAQRLEAVRKLEIATVDHERRTVELVSTHQRQLDTLEAEVKTRWEAADAQNAEISNVSITQLRERLAAGNRRVSQLEDDLRLAQLEVENWKKLDEARRTEMEKLVAVAAQGGDKEGNAAQVISSLSQITEQYSKRHSGKTELTKTLGQVAKELMEQADEIEVGETNNFQSTSSDDPPPWHP